MVIEDAGAETWDALERDLAIGPADMISAMVYPDDLTVELFQAAAARLGLSLEACLRRFGRHWVRFAAEGPYAGIMDFVSQDLAGFIANLDRMHQAVRAAMPGARVPSFTLLAQEPACLRVGYRSSRQGLEPLVVGLLEGLLDRFGLTGRVERSGQGEAGAEFIVLLG
ncbi:MAG: heme NO-binding domain-containing protein [Sphingomonadales bacterium]|nr:heme NO-binding domain-containing protein [Sphingomonadales bacterium]